MSGGGMSVTGIDSMWQSLTRSRSADFHRATMLRLLIAAGLLYLLWEPLYPVRVVTADILHTAGDLIAKDPLD